MHLEEYEISAVRRSLFRRSSSPKSERWVTVDYAYGAGPEAVDYTDDFVAGTVEEAGSLWTDGDVLEVEDERGRREYSVRALPVDQADWVRDWFKTRS
jgi:hypothetical protein